jgi:CheY-like chemotaxis protein
MKKALIIEDEMSIQEILSDVLITECGFDKVDIASDGLEGFLKSSLEKYDVICIDHMMPYFKGADLLLAIREKEGLNKHSPIFMISAYIPELSQDSKELEHTYFLDKPLDFPRFIRYMKMSVK